MQEWVGWEEGAVAIKGNVRGPCDRNVLYLDFVSGSISISWLRYCAIVLQNITIQRNRIKSTLDSSELGTQRGLRDKGTS